MRRKPVTVPPVKGHRRPAPTRDRGQAVAPFFCLERAAWIPYVIRRDDKTGECRGVEGPRGWRALRAAPRVNRAGTWPSALEKPRAALRARSLLSRGSTWRKQRSFECFDEEPQTMLAVIAPAVAWAPIGLLDGAPVGTPGVVAVDRAIGGPA